MHKAKKIRQSLATIGVVCCLGPSLGMAQVDSETLGDDVSLFRYLQNEPMTLFDAGMKSLRRMALDTASSIQSASGTKARASVRFAPVAQQIEISMNLQTKLDLEMEGMRKKCIELRKAAIVRMFRVGLTDLEGLSGEPSNLGTAERIRRRIGAQFAHEPTDTYQAFQRLGDRLGPITYFTLKLSSMKEPIVQVSCRGRVTDTLENTK